MVVDRYQRLALLLDKLALEMRACARWSENAPTPEALRSQSPFYVDTLSIWEWLQYVFLPRARDLIVSRQALPIGSNIAAMVEEVLMHDAESSVELLAVIRQIDTCLSLRS